jgi:hypothetical protein
VGDRPRGRFATPADFPRHDGSPYRTVYHANTHAAKVWDLSVVQGPFPVAPCQTLPLRYDWQLYSVRLTCDHQLFLTPCESTVDDAKAATTAAVSHAPVELSPYVMRAPRHSSVNWLAACSARRAGDVPGQRQDDGLASPLDAPPRRW